MTGIVQSIFQQVPWLKVFLTWALAVIVVLLVLALPAYFLFLPLTQRVRTELKRYLSFLQDRHAEKRRLRKEAEEDLVSQYAHDNLLRHVDASSGRLWAHTRATLLQRANEIQERLKGVTGSMEGFSKGLPHIHERLQAITDSLPKDFLPVTNDPGLSRATGTLRVARMSLACASFLLVAIIFVNTGMLSQIVRDLGFIPPSFKFAGIPLFYVLALLITCVEAGLGVIHGILADSEMNEDRGKIHVGSILAAVGAVGVAGVEGFFYSRIVPNRTDIVTIPLIGYTLPQTDVFFIWGFLLVMTLFGLGLICYRMAARVLRGTALTHLHKQLRAFNKAAVQWSGTLRQAESMATTARVAVASSQITTISAPLPTQAMERLLTELRSLLETQPRWVSVNEQALGAPEVVHLASHALLWFLLALGSAALATWAGIASFGRLALDGANPVALALGQVALVATAGFLVGWQETVVQGDDWQKVTAPSWARVLGLALAGCFTIAYLALIVSAYAAGVVLLWIGNILVCLVVGAACYQLIPLIGLGRIWTHRALRLLAGAGELLYRCLVGVLLCIAVFIDQVMMILAGPVLAFKGLPPRQ